MKNKLFTILMCCFAVVSLTLTFGGMLTTSEVEIAYTEEITVDLVVGQTYTYVDNGGEYAVTVLSDTEYSMHATNDKGEEFSYKGTYTYIGGKLTLTAFEEIMDVYTVHGDVLVEVVESDTIVSEPPTFLGRVMEYIEAYYAEIVTTVGDIVLFILFFFNYIKNKKNMLGITKKVTFTSNAQSDVVDVVNGLVEGYNKLESKFKEYSSSESQKFETVGSMVVQTKAILEILMTVYANSKNLPQGVKDLVNLKYATALKTLGDEEQLKVAVTEQETSVAGSSQRSRQHRIQMFEKYATALKNIVDEEQSESVNLTSSTTGDKL